MSRSHWENEEYDVRVDKEEKFFKNKKFSAVIQSFAAISTLLCNIGAYV